jgi:heterodisulfide reductase subunit B
MSEKPTQTGQARTISTDLAERIQRELGQNVFLCYQCVKCTSGCPLSEFFDWQPNQIMRAAQLGQEDIVFTSQTPWLCAACQTCTTRCPQGLDINAIMEFLARESLERGYQPPVPEVDAFNKAFLREVRLWGRSYELGLMAEMKLRNLRTHSLMEDMDLGVKVIQKGKLPFLPSRGKPPRRVKRLPYDDNAVAYYPGCSLHSTAVEFNASTKAVCQALGMNLVEPDGWVCCGSSAAHRADTQAALRLPLENLRLVEQSGFDEVTMPCAACFNRHKAAQYELSQGHASQEGTGLGSDYSIAGRVTVRSLIDSILQRVGVREIAGRVKKPLTGLRVVAYYGCLLTRPPQVTGASHPENPTEMDTLLSALGAQVVDWSYKTSCCGAAHSLTRPDIVLKLSSRLIENARQAGADVIAVACPLCHTNLDARQFQMKLPEPMPVLYFTQLMALALGLPVRDAALDKNLVDPKPLLRSKGMV